MIEGQLRRATRAVSLSCLPEWFRQEVHQLFWIIYQGSRRVQTFRFSSNQFWLPWSLCVAHTCVVYQKFLVQTLHSRFLEILDSESRYTRVFFDILRSWRVTRVSLPRNTRTRTVLGNAESASPVTGGWQVTSEQQRFHKSLVIEVPFS